MQKSDALHRDVGGALGRIGLKQFPGTVLCKLLVSVVGDLRPPLWYVLMYIASIPGRSQLRKTAWYTLSAHASIASRILGIEIS